MIIYHLREKDEMGMQSDTACKGPGEIQGALRFG